MVKSQKKIEIHFTVLLEFELSLVVDVFAEYKTRVFTAVVEMLRWFAGYQIRNVAVSENGIFCLLVIK